jgi:hypothetical protein
MLRTIAVVFVWLVMACAAASAAQLDGVTMPDIQDEAGTHLVLNGLALRTYSFLRVRIYVAGLYLEQRSSDADAILNSAQPKLLRFVFTRDVDADAARKSWRESFDMNCPAPCRLPADSIQRFLDGIPAMRKGDTSTFLFTPTGMDAKMNGRLIGRVPNMDFVKVILATFIGPHPTSAAVKRGLLGETK